MAQRQLDESLVTVSHLLSLGKQDSVANGPKLITEIKRFSASIVTQTTYGWRCLTGTEKDLLDLRHNVKEFEECVAPGAHFVGKTDIKWVCCVSRCLIHCPDTLTFLDYLPDVLSPWRKFARAQQGRNVDLFCRLVRDVKQRMQDGEEKASDSFAGRLWQEQAKYEMDDLDVAFIAGNMYEAAVRQGTCSTSSPMLIDQQTDTTAATLGAFFLAMCLYPQVQTKAHEEISRMCGHRSPTWSDLGSLLYVCAIVKESLRYGYTSSQLLVLIKTAGLADGDHHCLQVSISSAGCLSRIDDNDNYNIGVPHRGVSVEDDEYLGMRIPAGATIFANT